MRRTGTVNLPLHVGKAPRWLFSRMVRLAEGITEVIVYEYGQDEFLRRISDPCWFQALSCVLGFDWHSSGTTTTTCGALKVAINPKELGIRVAGGKGITSRKAPAEIEECGGLFSLSSKKIEELVYASRMSAKVDNSCVQDGYQLYHHCFFLAENGKWAVVQQGMNDNRVDKGAGTPLYARRYHWISEGIGNFIEEPHAGICCDRIENHVLDMTSRDSEENRKISLDLVNDNPAHLENFFTKNNNQKLISEFTMPSHHPIFDIDIGRNGMNVLQKAYEIQPENYEELVSLRGMGQKKIRALALISELLYGIEPSWKDPVKFSFTHGGKDGFPYPVDRRVYDNSIQVLKDSIEQAKLERIEKLYAIKRLKDFINSSLQS